MSLKFWKKKGRERESEREREREREGENLIIMEGVKIWFKNYYALTSFMWIPLTRAFRLRGRDKYCGMNGRLYAKF